MSRQLKELRGLMPFSWDARIEEHPVGSGALRDFAGAFDWSERHGRRSAGSPSLPIPLPPRKRAIKKATSAVSDGGKQAKTQTEADHVQSSKAPIPQTPVTIDSDVSSQGRLSAPAATPGSQPAVLRSSGRSMASRRKASTSPGEQGADVQATPAAFAQRSTKAPDSAASTGEQLQLRPRPRPPTDPRVHPKQAAEATDSASMDDTKPADMSVSVAAAGSTHGASVPGSGKTAAVSPAARSMDVSPPKTFAAKLAAVEVAARANISVDAEKEMSPATESPVAKPGATVAGAQREEAQRTAAEQQAAPVEPLQPEEPAPLGAGHSQMLASERQQPASVPQAPAVTQQAPPRQQAAAAEQHATERQGPDLEESLAAEILMALPRPPSAARQQGGKPHPRRPMHQLDTNRGQIEDRAGATKPPAKRAMIDAAWAAQPTLARKPPQGRRSERRITAASRASSPRLLPSFAKSPACVAVTTPSEPPPPPAQLSPLQAAEPPAAEPQHRTVLTAAPLTLTLSQPAPQPAPVSQAPPQMPQLLPIAPLNLQPVSVPGPHLQAVRLSLAPSVPLAPQCSAAADGPTWRLPVSAAPQLPPAPITARPTPAPACEAAALEAANKRQGEPLDFERACKLLRFLDSLEQSRRARTL